MQPEKLNIHRETWRHTDNTRLLYRVKRDKPRISRIFTNNSCEFVRFVVHFSLKSGEPTRLDFSSVHLRVSPWKNTRSRWIIVLLACAVLVGTPMRIWAQAQGPLARVASPANKQTLRGSVTILGTAQSSALARYELSFANEPDLTTWVSFGGATQSVNTAGLGVWNTRPLPDGEYALRLQVFSSNGSVIETVVRNLKIANGNTGVAAPSGSTSVAEPTVTASTTQRSSSFSLSDIPTAFTRGARYMAIGFVAFGLYLILKLGLHWLRKRVSQPPIDYGS